MLKLLPMLSFLLGSTFIQSSISLARAQVRGQPRCSSSFLRSNAADYDDRPVWGEVQNGNRNQPVQRPSQSPTQRTPPANINSRSQTGISRRKCQEYCKFSVLEAPTTKPPPDPNVVGIFVVGGEDTAVNEFPHMVALGFGTPGQPMAWNSCGGTLISEWYVLTAAHCMDSDLGNPSVIRLGAHNVQQDLSDKTTIEDVSVGDITIHPGYQGTKGDQSLYNDIALIRMSRAVEFRAGVQPACLHAETNINAMSAVATGWGNLGFTDAPSDTLQKVTLDIIPRQQCRTLIPVDDSIPQGILDTQICAGVLAGGKDTCSGDSGGPLQINNTLAAKPGFICGMQVVGVTSFGKFCAEKNSPGVYTRVAPFVPWIESIVWRS